MRASTDESGGSFESEHGVRGTDCGSLCAFTPRENRGSCAAQTSRSDRGRARPPGGPMASAFTPLEIVHEMQRRNGRPLLLTSLRRASCSAKATRSSKFTTRTSGGSTRGGWRLRLLTAGGARQGGCCPSNAHVSTVVSFLPHLRTLQHGFRKYTPPPHTLALASVFPPPSSFPPLHTPTPSHTTLLRSASHAGVSWTSAGCAQTAGRRLCVAPRTRPNPLSGFASNACINSSRARALNAGRGRRMVT